MRNKKKRTQREEVRKVLHAMRLELAAQRAAQEQHERTKPLRINELFYRAKGIH